MRWRSDLAAHTCARGPDGDGHGPRAVRASPEWIISNRRRSGQVSTAEDTLNRFAIPAAGARRAASAHHIGYTYVRVDAVRSSAVGRNAQVRSGTEFRRGNICVAFRFRGREHCRLAFPWTPTIRMGELAPGMSYGRLPTELEVRGDTAKIRRNLEANHPEQAKCDGTVKLKLLSVMAVI